ncbi:MAG: methionine adenosyltransferase domain-containing protein [Candidatus Uhrbacteria bacterium]
MRKAAEAVTSGHSDKTCDQIADAILDEFLRRDSHARVNVSVFGSHGMVMIGGEVASHADFDVASLVKGVYASIGHADDVEVFANIHVTVPEKLAPRVQSDSVVVNGYATKETREMLPRAFVYANNLARRLDDVRNADPNFSWLLPNGKVQVMMERDRVAAVTIQTAHVENILPRDVQVAILDRVIAPIVGNDHPQILVNPLGAFTASGFSQTSGMSGNKLGSDTYGGLIPHGDSAISGKDPSRPERCGAYLARLAARSLVVQGLATSAMVTVVYVPGRAEPAHLEVNGVSDKSRGSKMDFTNLIKQQFDFRPDAIVERLDLLKPIYQRTAAYGHFGRAGFPWEADV